MPSDSMDRRIDLLAKNWFKVWTSLVHNKIFQFTSEDNGNSLPKDNTVYRWYCISEVNAMFRDCDEYNRSHIQDWKNNCHPDSDVMYLRKPGRFRFNVTWIMVESTSGIKSLYFEEANCTVIASYYHNRKGSTDQSPQNLTPNRESWTKNHQTDNIVERHLERLHDIPGFLSKIVLITLYL